MQESFQINHETLVNMAAMNNKKTKSMECSDLKNHQLAILLFSADRAF